MNDEYGSFLPSIPDLRRLTELVRSATTPQRVVRRALIVLTAAAGMSSGEVAARVGVSIPTVRLWVRRFAEHGMDGILGAACTGVRHVAEKDRRGCHDEGDAMSPTARLLVASQRDPSLASLREAALELGVSPSTVWRVIYS